MEFSGRKNKKVKFNNNFNLNRINKKNKKNDKKRENERIKECLIQASHFEDIDPYISTISKSICKIKI